MRKYCGDGESLFGDMGEQENAILPGTVAGTAEILTVLSRAFSNAMKKEKQSSKKCDGSAVAFPISISVLTDKLAGESE